MEIQVNSNKDIQRENWNGLGLYFTTELSGLVQGGLDYLLVVAEDREISPDVSGGAEGTGQVWGDAVDQWEDHNTPQHRDWSQLYRF